MDDLLGRDFGFRAQGKAAPMAASKSTTGGNINFGIGSGGGDGRSSSFSSSNRGKSNWSSTPVGNSLFDEDNLFKSSTSQKNHGFDGLGGFNDVYGGPPPKYKNQSDSYESMFQSSKDSSGANSSSLPVFDKPVYDDDIFDGVPGMKSTTSVNYDDVFASISSPPKQNDHYDDLLGNFAKNEPQHSKTSSFRKTPEEVNRGVSSDFEDLIPGFGSSSPSNNRRAPETSQQRQSAIPSHKSTSVMEDPFVNIEPGPGPGPGPAPAYESSEIFSDPLEQFSKQKRPDNSKFNSSSGSGGVFEDLDPLDDLTKSMPSFSSGVKNRVEDKNSSRNGANATSMRKAAGEEPFLKPAKDASPKVEASPMSDVTAGSADDIWITVSEVPLYTQPTNAPPPSRPPPPRPVQVSKADDGYFSARKTNEKINDFPSFQHFSPTFQSPTTVPSSGTSMGVSPTDELEDFVSVRSRDHADDRAEVLSSEEEIEANSAAAASAAAMKEAMNRAEAKFKHAREVRERENIRTGRSREAAQQEKDEKALRDAQERELREKQERLDREREQREKEEKERERRRLEQERERARQVVERATREARERAAAEARQRSQKESRERAERAAVQRAQAEARERAAAEARERAERAAAEAKERSNAEARAAAARAETEARIRAERASVERAAAEARERAAAESRDRAAAAARERQRNENDLESFFSTESRASSAPRPNRTATSDSAFDSQFQNKPAPEGARRASPGTSSTIRKASSTTNIVDDLTSIFGGGASISGEFNEIDGETDERRRARLERHQRTQERAAKALAEKNERDMQTQREQAERNRLGETLDRDIKRWSAGKEGNLRALLSTLQYVLWPECGWQPVGLTDLITAAAVKKAYRKATLCIHPDKVQQKGANLQQKYIAEKVFDLLKEAWNKFNSEELF